MTLFDQARSRIFVRLALCFFLATMLWRIGQSFAYDLAVFHYPYQVDFGEGIVWQQMRDMVTGIAYAPLRVYPAIVYHYPPVYHLVTAAFAGVFGLDELFAGRLLSLLSTWATAMLVGLLAHRLMPALDGARVRLAAAVIAALLFLNCYPVMAWAPLMRVDMLSGALGLAGMVVALYAIDRPKLVYAAALLFTLSIYTKQISLAAPVAAFAMLLLVAPRTAIRGILCGLILSFTALAGLEWATHGRFLTHIIFYNVNRFVGDILFQKLLPMLVLHGALLLLAMLGAIACWRLLRRDGVRSRPAEFMLIVFVALKTPMLLGMLKSGSNYNYMVEWFSAIAILAAVGLRPTLRLVWGRDGDRAGMAAAVLMLIALPVQLMQIDFPRLAPAVGRASDYEAIVQRIAASPRPVIADDMTMLIRAGRRVNWEAAITAELGAAGVYDQDGFARLIQARCFGFFVTEDRAGSKRYDARYNPPVAAAIAHAYPTEIVVGHYVEHRPRQARDPVICRDIG